MFLLFWFGRNFATSSFVFTWFCLKMIVPQKKTSNKTSHFWKLYIKTIFVYIKHFLVQSIDSHLIFSEKRTGVGWVPVDGSRLCKLGYNFFFVIFFKLILNKIWGVQSGIFSPDNKLANFTVRIIKPRFVNNSK